MAVQQQRERRVGLHLPVQVEGTDETGSPFNESTRTLNISGGGVLFESRNKLAVGNRLSLQIQLPPPLRRHVGNCEVYRARAVVCRVEKFEGEDHARVGARFLGNG